MPKPTTTPLGYLMDMLYIQGTQLAKMVHVDRTVVSRWKNGRTELNMKSGYFDDIVKALLDINEQQGLGTLERFFSSLTQKTVDKRKELQKLVSTWLVSKEFDRQFKETDTTGSLYNASYKIFKGISGKWDAMQYMMDVLGSLSDRELLCGYDVSMDIPADTRDTGAFQKKLLGVLDRNCEVNLLFFINRPTDEVFYSFEAWLPIFLHRRTSAFFTYDVHAPFYDYIYSIKGKLALVGTSHDNNRANLYTAVYDDPMTLNQIDSYLDSLRGNMKPLYTHLDSHNMRLDYGDSPLFKHFKNASGQYIMQESFPLITFHRDTIQDIIADLELDANEEHRLLAFIKTYALQSRKMFAENEFTRIVFSFEYLQNIKSEPVLEVASFSSLLGRKIMIPTKYLIQETKSLIEFANHSSRIEIALRPTNVEAFLSNSNVWVKNNALYYIVPDNNASVRLISEEFATVNALYAKAEEYWRNLPYECKQQTWISEKIKCLE